VVVGQLLLPGAMPAQGGDRDNGRLVVRQGDAVIGEEEFSLEVVRDPEGATAVNLVVAASYPAHGTHRAAATFGSRRITVRISSGGTEIAREYPRSDRDLVIHESLLGLLAIAGQVEPGAVSLFAPPAPGRRTGSLDDLGTERLDPAGPALRHLAVRGGVTAIELWFDDQRRLVRVSLRDKDIVADRAPPP
jgi:hypothetical protein